MSYASTFEFWFMVFGAVLLVVAYLVNRAALRHIETAKRLYAEASSLLKGPHEH